MIPKYKFMLTYLSNSLYDTPKIKVMENNEILETVEKEKLDAAVNALKIRNGVLQTPPYNGKDAEFALMDKAYQRALAHLLTCSVSQKKVEERLQNAVFCTAMKRSVHVVLVCKPSEGEFFDSIQHALPSNLSFKICM